MARSLGLASIPRAPKAPVKHATSRREHGPRLGDMYSVMRRSPSSVERHGFKTRLSHEFGAPRESQNKNFSQHCHQRSTVMVRIRTHVGGRGLGPTGISGLRQRSFSTRDVGPRSAIARTVIGGDGRCGMPPRDGHAAAAQAQRSATRRGPCRARCPRRWCNRRWWRPTALTWCHWCSQTFQQNAPAIAAIEASRIRTDAISMSVDVGLPCRGIPAVASALTPFTAPPQNLDRPVCSSWRPPGGLGGDHQFHGKPKS